MAEAVFYILSSANNKNRYVFACKLAEKAFRSGRFCYIQTDNEHQARILDDLLWTFRPGSFIPHQIFEGSMPATAAQILIGTQPVPTGWQDLILNISNNSPENIKDNSRILEILDANEEVKICGRERYKHYHERGISITTHKM